MPSAQLVELYAHGLGIIEDARLEFGGGFNVLTGETGAGKTLLLGALNLCLGGDGYSARYALSPELRAAAVFVRSDGSESVLSRESGASGRLRSSLDGVSTSAETLRSVAQSLIVIHGQHDSLTLKNRADVLRIIDAFGRINSISLEQNRRQLAELHGLRMTRGGDAPSRAREIDFLNFQIAEIEGANIVSEHEIDDRLMELSRLSEVREAQAIVVDVLNRLDGDGEDAVLGSFARSIASLPKSIPFEPVRTALFESLTAARAALQELAELIDPDGVDEEQIPLLEERITTLRSLARKYDGTLKSTLEALDRMRVERDVLANTAVELSQLDERIHVLEAEQRQLSERLRAERESAAADLSAAIAKELPRVALAGATLHFRTDGLDGSIADILFSSNPGTPAGPLQSLASGGELSRVLLAVALQTAADDVVAVFDEVDAGIGGQVAQQIGECLRELGKRQQVIAVTHLASIAAKADRHFVVEKTTSGDATVTAIRQLDEVERIDEIARMLAGTEMSLESRALARRLLETSR